jgi:hypothetical protein
VSTELKRKCKKVDEELKLIGKPAKRLTILFAYAIFIGLGIFSFINNNFIFAIPLAVLVFGKKMKFPFSIS